jgi:hypothetical protein
MKAGQFEQQAYFAVLPDKSIEFRDNALVIRLYQLAGHLNGDYLSAVFFLDLHGHRELLASNQLPFCVSP